MYICMCVCVFVCVCRCVCVSVCECACVSACVHASVCACMYMSANLHVPLLHTRSQCETVTLCQDHQNILDNCLNNFKKAIHSHSGHHVSTAYK